VKSFSSSVISKGIGLIRVLYPALNIPAYSARIHWLSRQEEEEEEEGGSSANVSRKYYKRYASKRYRHRERKGVGFGAGTPAACAMES
jgi:hypothetical protein